MRILFFLFVFGWALPAAAQFDGYTKIDGRYLPYTISDCGDTLLIANLDDVTYTEPRMFDNEADRRLYRKYKRYALKVYPYALEAIQLYKELDVATQDYAPRHRQKYTNALHRELKDDFAKKLKKLTKTQGMILMKMIERELDTAVYYVIKDLKSGFTATYWSTLASFYGHKLRDGYVVGEDPILDMVLDDLDVSYEVPETFVSHFKEGEPFRVKKKWKRRKKRNKVRRLVNEFLGGAEEELEEEFDGEFIAEPDE